MKGFAAHSTSSPRIYIIMTRLAQKLKLREDVKDVSVPIESEEFAHCIDIQVIPSFSSISGSVHILPHFNGSNAPNISCFI